MINSTNTLNIDGTTFDDADIKRFLSFDRTDTFSRWVVRPLAALTVIGLIVASVFASVFFIAASLALLPIMALAMWAVRKKIERDIKAADPVVDVQESSRVVGAEDASGASHA